MPLDRLVRNSGKWLDTILLFGVLARLSKKIRYSKSKRNESWVDPTSLIDRESVLVGNNKIYANVRLNKTSVGKFSYIGPDSRITITTIGSFCSIGCGVSIGLGLHPSNWLSTHPAFYSVNGQTTKTFSKSNRVVENTPINIGHDVWIGANAMVMDGVTIASGEIVAAGAIVTKDVRPYAIVAGVPALEIKHRFNDGMIAELIDWAWCALPDVELSILANNFNSNGNWTVAELKTAIGRSARQNGIATMASSDAK